jgi:NAD(P)-dependent dehydrogenase (short-subunit alcohol dehydrogenase family)
MIVVTGATGRTGRRVTGLLLAKGEKVRVVGRNATNLARLVQLGAEPFVGNVEDVDSMTSVILGRMKSSRIIALILSLVVLQSGATAQMKSLCFLVTVEDARAFFGGPPQQDMSSPQMCAYSSKGQTVTLAIANYTAAANVQMLFEMNRQGMKDAKGSPKDEPGLGATAFSASTESTFEIFLLKGNATVQLTAASANGRTAIAATELDKLREVAKRAADRM